MYLRKSDVWCLPCWLFDEICHELLSVLVDLSHELSPCDLAQWLLRLWEYPRPLEQLRVCGDPGLFVDLDRTILLKKTSLRSIIQDLRHIFNSRHESYSNHFLKYQHHTFLQVKSSLHNIPQKIDPLSLQSLSIARYFPQLLLKLHNLIPYILHLFFQHYQFFSIVHHEKILLTLLTLNCITLQRSFLLDFLEQTMNLFVFITDDGLYLCGLLCIIIL